MSPNIEDMKSLALAAVSGLSAVPVLRVLIHVAVFLTVQGKKSILAQVGSSGHGK